MTEIRKIRVGTPPSIEEVDPWEGTLLYTTPFMALLVFEIEGMDEHSPERLNCRACIRYEKPCWEFSREGKSCHDWLVSCRKIVGAVANPPGCTDCMEGWHCFSTVVCATAIVSEQEVVRKRLEILENLLSKPKTTFDDWYPSEDPDGADEELRHRIARGESSCWECGSVITNVNVRRGYTYCWGCRTRLILGNGRNPEEVCRGCGTLLDLDNITYDQGTCSGCHNRSITEENIEDLL